MWYTLPAWRVVPFASEYQRLKGLIMKVLLLKDVYKLGRAGDVKRVADGYGRNFLIPKNLAVLATPGAMKQVEHIRQQATVRRAALNQEMGSVAEVLAKLVLTFGSKAGETGKLYGSITHQMIADAIQTKTGITVDRHQIDIEPIRTLGEKKAHIRLTVDLMPEIKIIVHREGEVIAAVPVVETPVDATVEEPLVETRVVEPVETVETMEEKE
ncbi:MAG: 50S ribosomal protein L9 [Anaerolinea sp.]|nr:50S ribosomal protein L9 [Anaerolinea sp.]